jgi:TolB-like protein/tetratricopeptide (TPR) repeat protein/predicted Ser/Thr protein kinase
MDDTKVGHYDILKKLGAGGMGEVYLAQDTRLNRWVALKFLPESLCCDAEARARLLREAQAASKLSHPNIVTVYAVEEDKGRDFIAMEYITGLPLTEYTESSGRKLPEMLTIAVQIVEGLNKAHQTGVVHRDLKPSNILIDSEGRARILDFGLAKIAGAARVTQIGSTVGTAAYMSPEQVQGQEADQRSDLFSFGVVLYEMIAGCPPFRGEHPAALMYAITNEEPEPLARYKTGVPEELQRIISKCLAKRPGERYQSAADLASDLRRVHDRSASGITVMPTPRRTMLAVLPFENLGPADDEYFADGITEEITSRLAAVGGLGVISRTSAMQYKGTRKSLREIGADLGVDYILEGTVRWGRMPQGPSRVRITPQLIRVAEDTHVWSERYDRVIEDIFAVQSEIAEQVFGKLNVTLVGPERRDLEVKPTDNLDAYSAYLRGIDYARRPDYRAENFRLAAQMFERAVELDPRFALAYAELAVMHSALYFYGYDRTPARLSQSKAAVDRALALQPDLPEGRTALGFYYYRGSGDWERALVEFERAARDRPNDSGLLCNIAAIRRRQGRFGESLDLWKAALELDPRAALLAMETGITCTTVRRYADAERFLDRSMALAPDQTNAFSWKARLHWLWGGNLRQARSCLAQIAGTSRSEAFAEWYFQLLYEKDYPAALRHVLSLAQECYEDQIWFWPKPQLLGEIHEFMGQRDQARSFYETVLTALHQHLAAQPGDYRILVSLGMTYAGLGRKEEAVRAAQEAVALVPIAKDALVGPVTLQGLAYVNSRVGEHEAALDLIEQLLAMPSWISTSLLRIDPYFDPLRDHPRFQDLLKRSDKVF